MQICAQCSETFEITDQDRAFYQKVAPTIGEKSYPIPEPKHCPNCRQQRRLAFYNRRTLHMRECAKSKKDIVSIYSPDSPHIIYDVQLWYEDDWDPLDYGQEIDFTRPFFEQFQELMLNTPLPSLTLLGGDININSDYNNDNFKLKNCYLTFDGDTGEDCMYGESFRSLKNCTDFLFLELSERCYECVNAWSCYEVYYSRFCNNCHNSWFLKECVGCKNCFGCANLRQKEYYIFTEHVGKERFEQFMKEFNSGSFKVICDMRTKAEEFFRAQPTRAIRMLQNEDCFGDNLSNSKNSVSCYDSENLFDCKYVTNNAAGGRDLFDLDVWGAAAELCYNNCVIGESVQRIIGGFYISEGCSDILYSIFCSRNSSHLFGCIGLRHKKHCILNKQYTPEEYETLAGKLIEHMQATGEWGEFFPETISPFGYNETVAQNFFPLTHEQVQEKGWHWREVPNNLKDVKRVIAADLLPDSIDDIPDDVLNWAIECMESSRQFKLTTTELEFYREHRLPIPRFHPDIRHKHRSMVRNHQHIWMRKCTQCEKEVPSTVHPNRPEKIYCDTCYQEQIL